MQAKPDSLRRFAFDVGVTLVLIFAAILGSDFVAGWIVPGFGVVSVLCAWIALVPAGLWLRRCRVGGITRAQLGAIVLSSIVFSLAFDFIQPNPGAIPAWGVGVILFAFVRLAEWLLERVPMLCSSAEEQVKRAEE